MMHVFELARARYLMVALSERVHDNCSLLKYLHTAIAFHVYVYVLVCVFVCA